MPAPQPRHPPPRNLRSLQTPPPPPSASPRAIQTPAPCPPGSCAPILLPRSDTRSSQPALPDPAASHRATSRRVRGRAARWRPGRPRDDGAEAEGRRGLGCSCPFRAGSVTATRVPLRAHTVAGKLRARSGRNDRAPKPGKGATVDAVKGAERSPTTEQVARVSGVGAEVRGLGDRPDGLRPDGLGKRPDGCVPAWLRFSARAPVPFCPSALLALLPFSPFCPSRPSPEPEPEPEPSATSKTTVHVRATCTPKDARPLPKPLPLARSRREEDYCALSWVSTCTKARPTSSSSSTARCTRSPIS